MDRKHEKYERLIARCKELPPTPTAVAHPCDESSLRGALEAAEMGILTPILVGPRGKIESVAQQFNLDISAYTLIDAEHSVAAAAAAVRVASLTLVPARPSAFDLAAILETIELVRHANGRAGAVINAIPASSTVADQAQDVIERAGLKVLARIGQRIAWQHAAARGRGVYETEPGGASASELVRLWNAIHEHMNACTHEDMTP